MSEYLEATRQIRALDLPPEVEFICGVLANLQAYERSSGNRVTWQSVADAYRAGQPLPFHIHDPIETGREAALGQWEARWEALRRTGQWFIDHGMGGPQHMVTVQSVMTEMDQIEAAIPTGLAVGERWIPRMTGRVNLQLEPERVDRLIELLPLGLHQGDSVEARDMYDADALAEDITNMKDRP